LLHASFRPHLAMTPLRFAIPSPPPGWEEDFHLQAAGHARHTIPRLGACGTSLGMTLSGRAAFRIHHCAQRAMNVESTDSFVGEGVYPLPALKRQRMLEKGGIYAAPTHRMPISCRIRNSLNHRGTEGTEKDTEDHP
jgi:hypothetical protein